MNFNPTKRKIIGTILVWFLTNFIFWLFYPIPCVAGINKECVPALPTINSALYFTFSHPFSWLFLVLVYMVWSLIQKR